MTQRGTPDEPWTASWHCNIRHLHQVARGTLPRDWQRYAQFCLRYFESELSPTARAVFAKKNAQSEADMPLKKGRSRKTISANIRELEHSRTKAGRKRTHKQNVAIALKKAGRSRHK